MSFAIYPSLNGAVVFITGGASGIGEEIVRAFAAQGSRIGFIDIDTERGGALADELGGQDATIHFEPCDLRDIDALKRAFAALEAALGPATVLVNNAARDDRHDWQEVTPDYYDERIATNLRHMFFADSGGGPGHDRRGQGLDHQLWLQLVVASDRRHARLHLGQGRGARHDPLLRARPRPASHTGQHSGAWLGHDRTAEDTLGDAGGPRAASQKAVPAGSDRAGYLARMVLFLASDDAAMCTANNYMVEAGSI